ncbi:hypothetical protein [Streptomyces sp. P9-A2]|uniref:hypothetical protein n=1 Tax=Streptomyces sp. P9-A2 TaxID=3072284 RepID=UPI002FC8494B
MKPSIIRCLKRWVVLLKSVEGSPASSPARLWRTSVRQRVELPADASVVCDQMTPAPGTSRHSTSVSHVSVTASGVAGTAVRPSGQRALARDLNGEPCGTRRPVQP